MGNPDIQKASLAGKVGLVFHKVVAAYPLEDMRLLVWFVGGESKTYDVAPLARSVSAFEALADPVLFSQVKVDAGGYGISWNDDIDLAGNELFDNGSPIDVTDCEKARLLEDIARSRRESGLSQGLLEEASGVRQPVIARLELGSVSPQIDTVLRILGPLGKTLQVVDLDGRLAQ